MPEQRKPGFLFVTRCRVDLDLTGGRRSGFRWVCSVRPTNSRAPAAGRVGFFHVAILDNPLIRPVGHLLTRFRGRSDLSNRCSPGSCSVINCPHASLGPTPASRRVSQGLETTGNQHGALSPPGFMPGEQGFGDSGGQVVKPGLYRHEAGRGSSGAEGRVVVVKPGFYRHRAGRGPIAVGFGSPRPESAAAVFRSQRRIDSGVPSGLP